MLRCDREKSAGVDNPRAPGGIQAARANSFEREPLLSRVFISITLLSSMGHQLSGVYGNAIVRPSCPNRPPSLEEAQNV
jgi:hypothetical protein